MRATAVTLLGLILWVALARSSFLEPEEGWLKVLGGDFQRFGSLLAIGVMPWIVVVFALQIMAALFKPFNDWLCARTPCERSDVLKWIAAGSLVVFMLAAKGRAMTLHQLSGPAGLPYIPGADILAGLLLGSLAAAAVLVLVQKVGPGFGFTLTTIFGAVAVMAPKFSPYLVQLRAHWFIGSIQLLIMLCTGFLLVWLVGMTYEAPADLTPGGRDAPPIQVPVLIVGVLPLVLSEIAMRVLRGALLGMGSEFEIYRPMARIAASLLGQGGLFTPFVQLALVWILTSATFSILYPTHRLELIFGLSRERIDESLESFLDGLLIQNALILCGVYVAAQLCSSSFAWLGLTPAKFMLLVAGLAAIRRQILMRRALEQASGGLVCAKTVLGLLEGEVARARLAAAGIPSYLNGWSVQELHPVTIAGMGEMSVLVPHRVADEARKLLA